MAEASLEEQIFGQEQENDLPPEFKEMDAEDIKRR